MSENTESQSGTQGLTEAEKAESSIMVDETNENPDVQFDSLFDEEVSESELQGDAPTEEEEPATSESKGDDEKPAEEKKEAEPAEKKEEKEPEEKEVKAEESQVDYSKPPPTGYVPLPALHEARRDNDAVKGQLDLANQNIRTLQAQIAAMPKGESSEEDKDFKPLSDKEFDELVEEDVEQALIYKNKFDKYKETQAEKRNLEQMQQYNENMVLAEINKSVERIGSDVPGIYDEGSTIGSELFNFAVENGFNDKFLSLLTAPATRLNPVDKDGKVSGQSIPLADGAASLISMLYKLKQASKAGDSESVRAEIEADIRKDEREKVTQELITKFKTENAGDVFRSIADGPGGSNDEPGQKQFYSESDLSDMSEEEERRILGG